MGADFDIESFFRCVDAERTRRALTWSGLVGELNAVFSHRPDIPPISASTLTGMRSRGGLAGNWVVHTLMWLRRTPEEFVPGHPVESVELPELRRGYLPRWDGEAIYQALDKARADRGVTWTSIAAEIGRVTPATLRNMRRGVGFPAVMWVLAWLRLPAAQFVVNVPV